MSYSEQVNELLCRLVEQASEHALVLLNPTGHIIAWLGASERVFGYTSQEALGRTASDLFTPEDIAKGMPQFEIDVASSDGHAEDDRWMKRKDGRRFWATGVLVPIRDDHGQLLGFGKILRNRTDLKGQIESAQN